MEEHGPGLTVFALNMEENMSELMLLKHLGLYLAVIKADKVPGWENGLNPNATVGGSRALAHWLTLLSPHGPHSPALVLLCKLPGPALGCSGEQVQPLSCAEPWIHIPWSTEGSAQPGQGLVGHSAGLCTGTALTCAVPRCVLPRESESLGQPEGGREEVLAPAVSCRFHR